eukprot:CAMPEP_0202694660 /NCGR_PEP_ID=MMETSP1385-20130828/8464_1 /ASSEMBLY_ACC=CAM_ASM_000861 /TAXON_ID=933848 /ORGANISM="Elphidium margaritaceum" /LENGTH=232 /DNA_ID=CAMNT_0049350549 /DNA_START=107 /DNA_END=805 /DNA_ORIENTATION=+
MRLVEFDAYLFQDLHRKINAQPHHITLDELSTIMKWKLFRGQFRPRLQSLIDSNDNSEVIECTQNAFALINSAVRAQKICDVEIVKKAINVLCRLKGVGVATASLILAIATKVIPFMADESMRAIWPNKTLKYDMKTYMSYLQELIKKCATMKVSADIDDDDNQQLTPFVLGECLWTQYMLNKWTDVDVCVDGDKKTTKPIAAKKKLLGKKRKLEDTDDLDTKGTSSKKRKL